MIEKLEIPRATDEQIQASRERILKQYGRPMPGAVVVKCLACIEQYGQGNTCVCGTAVPLHIPFPEEHKRFIRNIFSIVGNNISLVLLKGENNEFISKDKFVFSNIF